MAFKAGMGARLGLRGTLAFKNDAGEVIKTVEMNGSIPIAELGLSPEQAQQLIDQQAEQQKRERPEAQR